MIAAQGSPKKASPGVRKRGNAQATISCDCCLLFIYGVYFNCATCWDFDLCFKCYKSKSVIHPHHEFNLKGSEWDMVDAVDEKSGSEDGRQLGSEQVEPAERVQFDDEIVGEDDESMVE